MPTKPKPTKNVTPKKWQALAIIGTDGELGVTQSIFVGTAKNYGIYPLTTMFNNEIMKSMKLEAVVVNITLKPTKK